MPTYLAPGVFVEEVDSGSRPIEGVGTAVAAFVGLAEDGPFNSPTLVSNWSQFTGTFGSFVDGAYLAQSVYAYFQNGGGNCYVVRIGEDPAANNGRRGAAPKALPAGPQGVLGGYKITALDAGTPDGQITVEAWAGGEDAPEGSFKLLVKRGDEVLEEHDKLVTGRGRQNVMTAVNAASKLIKIEEAGRLGRRGAGGRIERGARVAPAARRGALRPAVHRRLRRRRRRPHGFRRPRGHRRRHHGVRPRPDERLSARRHRPGDRPGRAAGDDRPLRADGRPDRDPGPAARTQRPADQGVAGRQGRLRLEVRGAVLAVGEGGGPGHRQEHPHAAQRLHGRHLGSQRRHPRCPQGAGQRGDPRCHLAGDPDHPPRTGAAEPSGINCLRAFPGQGIRVWGARTLSSDPAWRYLNVRRLFNYLEKSILSGTNWVVFEPNDEALWAKIRRTLSAFLVNEWRKGALFGRTPDEAFFVKCDGETNPAEGIDAGRWSARSGWRRSSRPSS